MYLSFCLKNRDLKQKNDLIILLHLKHVFKEESAILKHTRNQNGQYLSADF